MSKKQKKAVSAVPLTLQHTREGTNWPDLELCEETNDTIAVQKSQVASAKEYTITSRDQDGHITELRDNNGEEFWTSYNPALERYYVRSKDPNKPFRTPQHMTGHRAFFESRFKTIVWMIPRNGSCTILASLMNDKHYEINCNQPAAIWNCIGHTNFFFDETKSKLSNTKWLEYKQCVVYQDPLLKCVRHLNYILSCNKPQLHTFFADCPKKELDIGSVIDTYLAVAEINTHNNVSYYEQHMMPQMFYHRTLPVQIDAIVDLDSLGEFVRQELKVTCCQANIEATIGLLLDDLTEARRARIDRIYGQDYEIAKRFKDRWWTP